MITSEVYRVFWVPFIGEPKPWLVVNTGTGVVDHRFESWSHADQEARELNRQRFQRWRNAARRARHSRGAAA